MARTEYTFALNSEGRGVGGAASINLAITDDAATTAVIKMAGCPFGRIRNESGGTITLTFYDATSKDGTALDLLDQDNVAAPNDSFVVTDDKSRELPDSIKGCEYLVIKGAAAYATGVSIHLER